MIDIQTEDVVTFKDAAAQMPGKPRSVQTLYRWGVAGVRGVVLETISVGGTQCTSWEALQRFFERIDAVKKGGKMPQRSSVQRKRAVENAVKEYNKRYLPKGRNA